jgi:oligoendopeptidase F
MTAKTLDRGAIAQQDKWNVEALFSSVEEWKKTFTQVARPSQRPHWPEIGHFKGKLAEGPLKVKEFLDFSWQLERQLLKLYTYIRLRHDEEITSEEVKKAQGEMAFIYQDFMQEMAWAEPEMLALPESMYKEILQGKSFEPYRLYFSRILRMRPHVLSAEQEVLLAQLDGTFSSPAKAFQSFNNADLQFPPIEDEKGNKQELTHGKYQVYLRSPDRQLRKNAFETMCSSFDRFENTLTELIGGHVQAHLFQKKARKYDSCLECALFPFEVDPQIYRTLIATVRANLGALHRYIGLRKKLLKVEKLCFYDLYVPLVEKVDLRFSYTEAEGKVIASVEPLGREYQSLLQKGLQVDRWVDRYENLRKRSGAYSSCCYDSLPYILLNYQGTFTDLMTLAHEAGHSMHSLLSNRTQPYQYSQYPLFLAEIASTFNEELLFHFLMEREKSGPVRRFLISQKLDDIRATFFRQVLFAEFELLIHELVEQGIPLTPAMLKEKYLELNHAYFGSEMEIDPLIAIEWARIPHFYYNFYVYQYATGISAAYALFKRVMEGGEREVAEYLGFLSAGCSKPPLEILKSAGVDLSTAAPIEALIRHFEELTRELEGLSFN